MQILNIKVADSIDSAPVYDIPEFTRLELREAVIVPRGTKQGNPTVDLVFTGPDGQKFVCMVTHNLLDGLAAAMRGVKRKGAN